MASFCKLAFRTARRRVLQEKGESGDKNVRRGKRSLVCGGREEKRILRRGDFCGAESDKKI